MLVCDEPGLIPARAVSALKNDCRIRIRIRIRIKEKYWF